MDEVGGDLAGVFYSLVALEQPISLGELAEGASTRTFPALSTHTPEWFAAAASGSDLLAMAPELQALPPEEDAGADRAQSADVDLIHVYAPEMAALEDLDEEPPVPSPPASHRPASQAATGTQIGLLKELDDLDD